MFSVIIWLPILPGQTIIHMTQHWTNKDKTGNIALEICFQTTAVLLGFTSQIWSFSLFKLWGLHPSDIHPCLPVWIQGAVAVKDPKEEAAKPADKPKEDKPKEDTERPTKIPRTEGQVMAGGDWVCFQTRPFNILFEDR